MASMTLAQAKVKAIKLINQYSSSGEITPSTDGTQLDFTLRMNDLADDAQKEIARFVKMPAVYSITQWPDENLLGITAFDMERYEPDKTVEKTATGAKAYYFEVDRPGTVYIEEEISGVWTVLKTITVTGITKFTGYKGNLTLTSAANSVRMRFTGSYPYTIRNRAFFKNNYSTDNDVPTYKPFIPYTLPDDFLEFNKIMQWYDQRQYEAFTGDYRFTGKKTIEINWFQSGQFDIHYYKLPATIDENTVDSYEFEVDENAQNLIPYYMAANVCTDQMQNIKIYLKQQYDNKLANLSSSQTPYQEGEIINVTNW
ncbi:MAG: hypothetical protein Q8873_00525 [Bacillota bacterium]|nr:hypothetical protein [Bacillota bacterium]